MALRIGIQLFGGRQWVGGAHYLESLLSALADLPGRPVEVIGIAERDADPQLVAKVTPFLAREPITLGGEGRASRIARLTAALVGGRDPVAARCFRDAGIDLLFHHMVFYGSRLGIPTLAWLPDFQHRRLPNMFSRSTWWRRELGYRALTSSSSGIVVSSEDARRECEQHYPVAAKRIHVMRFAARVPSVALECRPEEVRRKYHLPDKFLYFPGQLWKHKNHLGVVEALRILKSRGQQVVVVSSGSLDDYRDPAHGQRVLQRIRELDLGEHFRVLGVLPYADALMLNRMAVGLMNPSLSEGWSTTVEEGKGLGCPLLLSNIAVHIEQAGATARYFDSTDPSSMARAMAEAWSDWAPGPRPEAERSAIEKSVLARVDFARAFVGLVENVVSSFNRAAVTFLPRRP